MDIKAWLKQPATIHGLSALAGTAVGVGTWYATKDWGAALTASGIGFGVIAAVLPDNTNDKSTFDKLFADTLKMITAKQYAAMAPVVAADLMALFQTAITTTTVSTTTATPDGAAKTEAVTETVSTPVVPPAPALSIVPPPTPQA